LIVFSDYISLINKVLRLGEGCQIKSSIFAQCFWQLLPNRCYLLGGLSVGTLKQQNE
jgi:hypothetical protein